MNTLNIDEADYSWLQIFREISDRLPAYESRQQELVAVLSRTLKSEQTERVDGETVELSVMDPFSFIASYLTFGNAKRIECLGRLAEEWQIDAPLPTAFDGVPSPNSFAKRYFGNSNQRSPGDIAVLWETFKRALDNNLSEEVFGQALSVHRTGADKLTEGLFWVRPELYFPINQPTRYLLEQYGLRPTNESWSEYSRLLKEVKQKFDKPFYKLSHIGYVLRQRSKDDAAATAENQNGTLTEDEWREILATEAVTQQADRELLAEFYYSRGHGNYTNVIDARLKNLPEEEGWTGPVNQRTAAFAQRTIEHLDRDIALPRRKNGKEMYWSLLFTGAEEKDGFRWTLHDELVAALEETDWLRKSNGQRTTMERKKPLNLILYGPPGTGKTYSTINRAVSIVNPDFGNGSVIKRGDLRKEYQRLLTEGKIVFTTFHQSLSYEDFVEGIKPVISETEEGATSEIGYKVQPGIFKELVNTVKTANRAASDGRTRKGLLIDKEIIASADPFKISLGDATDPNDAGIYEYCVENNCIALGYGDDVDLTGFNTEKEIIAAIREQRGGEPHSKYEITAIKAFTQWMKVGDLVFVPNGLQTIRAVGRITSDYYFDKDAPIRYSQFRKVEWLYTDIAFPIKQIYGGKQFSVQTTYGMYSEVIREGLRREHERKSVATNYVLIIDEINRGNVSAILGELITLLEKDKRLGKAEELKVTLPYSRHEFGVPPNLYIIGTMNTADRSVEALDAALRRRFVFEEVGPDSSVIGEVLSDTGGNVEVAGKTVQLDVLLDLLNGRIAALKDNDHRLGHSYFLKVRFWQALREVMVDRVVPLLREYFFANYAQLQMVVGKGFCQAVLHKAVSFAETDAETGMDTEDLLTYHFPRPEREEDLAEFLDHLGYPW